jgi:hypothetical protein
MAEVMQKSTHVAPSKQRCTLLLSAMLHFAKISNEERGAIAAQAKLLTNSYI